MAKDDLTPEQCKKIIRAKGFKKYFNMCLDIFDHADAYQIYLEEESPCFFKGNSFAQAMKLVDKHFKAK